MIYAHKGKAYGLLVSVLRTETLSSIDQVSSCNDKAEASNLLQQLDLVFTSADPFAVPLAR